eukprot:scaffold8630_cov115-Isochrysis_galbana.AAC.11
MTTPHFIHTIHTLRIGSGSSGDAIASSAPRPHAYTQSTPGPPALQLPCCRSASSSAAKAAGSVLVEPKSALPATSALAPAAAASGAVAWLMPPSACSTRSCGNSARSWRSLSRHAGWKGCPPRPGSTHRTSTTSHTPVRSSGAMAATGVAGATHTPARQPDARIWRASASASAAEPSASHCSVMEPAPAAAKAVSSSRVGCATPRCTSTCSEGAAAWTAATVAGPMLEYAPAAMGEPS